MYCEKKLFEKLKQVIESDRLKEVVSESAMAMLYGIAKDINPFQILCWLYCQYEDDAERLLAIHTATCVLILHDIHEGDETLKRAFDQHSKALDEVRKVLKDSK